MENSILATLPPEIRNLIYKEVFGMLPPHIGFTELCPYRTSCGRLDFHLDTCLDRHLTMGMTATLACKQMRSESLGVMFGQVAILFCDDHEEYQAHELAEAAHNWLVGLGSTILWLRYVGVEIHEVCRHRLLLDKRGLTSLLADFLNLCFANNIPCFTLLRLEWCSKDDLIHHDLRSLSLLDGRTTFDELDSQVATFVNSARDPWSHEQSGFNKRDTERNAKALQKYLVKLRRAIMTKRGAAYSSPVRLENMPDPSARQQEYHLGRQLYLQWKAAFLIEFKARGEVESSDETESVETASA